MYLQCVIAVRVLKQQLTSFFTAPVIIVQGKPWKSDLTITKILLFGDNKLDFETNEILLMSTIEFISLTERFSCLLLE